MENPNKFKYLYIDPALDDIGNRIVSTQKILGICIFIDIVGSTALKDKPVFEWVKFLHSTFWNIKTNHKNLIHPLKGIGDEFMFYIPDSNLDREKRDAPYLDFFLAIVGTITDAANMPYGDQLQDVKIHAGYCQNVYPFSFIKNSMDVYGKDIDLVARLGKKGGSRQLIINEQFYDLLKEESKTTPNLEEDYQPFIELDGPRFHYPKGTKGRKYYFSWDAN